MLTSSLTAYGVSTLVCVAISLLSSSRFDFAQIQQRVGNYGSGTPTGESETGNIGGYAAQR